MSHDPHHPPKSSPYRTSPADDRTRRAIPAFPGYAGAGFAAVEVAMGIMWEYPDNVRAKWRMPSQQERERSNQSLADRHSETLARLERQTAENEDLRREKELALQWCRANGNPHLPEAVELSTCTEGKSGE